MPSSRKPRFSHVLGRCAVSTLKQARRLVVLVIGCSLLLAGVMLIFLPGPAVVVIPLSLALLATEFLWAKKLLAKFNSNFKKLTNFNRKPAP